MRSPVSRPIGRLALVAALALAAALPATAQPRLRWGSIPDEHKAATGGPDSSAVAVVLADAGYVHFTDDGKQLYERHRRVKLLSTNAFESWGTVEIVYNNEYERLRELRAQTLVPQPDGSYRRVEVGRRDFFNETLGAKVKRSRFTFPALEPGAIVEYSYEILSENIFSIPSWSFQSEEPTLWSEFRLDLVSELGFVYAFNNVTPDAFAVNTRREEKTLRGTTTNLRWGLRDVPALRPEPLSTALSDAETRIDFQLMSVNIPGFGSESFLNSWPQVVNTLLGRDGHYRRAMTDVSDRASAVIGAAQATTNAQKMEALYQFVATSIQTDGFDILPTRTAAEVLRERKGTSSEVNLLLVSLLRDAGLTAHPALVSTRDNGAVRRGYPIMSQFNRVIAVVREGEQVTPLDATEPLRPSSLLPERYVNNLMWVVKAPEGEWLPMRASGRRSVVAVSGTLGSDLSVRGRVDYSSTGHGALADRLGLRDASDEAAYVREEILEVPTGVAVDSVVVHEKTVPASPLRVEASFVREGAAQDVGGRLYLQPVFFDQTAENPLVRPTRQLPVDIGSPIDATYTLRLTLPDDLVLAETPVPKRVTLPGGGVLSSSVTQTGPVVSYLLRFQLTQPVYERALYDQLRGFFEVFVAAQAEPLVLQRRTPAAGSGGE